MITRLLIDDNVSTMTQCSYHRFVGQLPPNPCVLGVQGLPAEQHQPHLLAGHDSGTPLNSILSFCLMFSDAKEHIRGNL